MTRPEIPGWAVSTNENEVEIASINRAQLVEIIKYVDYLESKAQDNPVTLPKLILEEFPVELHEGTFWIASLQGFPGVVVQAETRDKAIKELMISIEVKLCFDAGIKPTGIPVPPPTDEDIERFSIEAVTGNGKVELNTVRQGIAEAVQQGAKWMRYKITGKQ